MRVAAGAPGRRGEERAFRAVRCGVESVAPQLALPSGVDLPPETTVRAPVVLGTAAGALTEVTGPQRAVRRTARWLVTQLLIRPAEERSPVVPAGDQAQSVLDGQVPTDDLTELIHLEEHEDISVAEDAAGSPVMVVSLEDLPDHDITPSPLGRRVRQALDDSWHLMLLSPDGSTGTRPSIEEAVRLDLGAGTSSTLDSGGERTVQAEEVIVDGISQHTAAVMLHVAPSPPAPV